ncbi:hypothetical protein A7982_13760 [Minicystis rosea]|nr:hypothetical protein A7982_13760 [Minicystis rosea]
MGNRATREMLGAGDGSVIQAKAADGGAVAESAAEADRSPWGRSKETEESLENLAKETNSRRETASREHLAREIERQVPDLEIFRQVREGTANTVVMLLLPGGGPTGVKTMNDRLVGYELNNSVFAPRRNEVFAKAFLGQPLREGERMSVVEQSYKSVTLTTNITDEARLQGLMRKAMREADRRMYDLLLETLEEGEAHWTEERNAASGNQDGEQYKDAKARVDNIEELRRDVRAEGRDEFHFDVQFGMAAIAGGVETAKQAYAAALGPR